MTTSPSNKSQVLAVASLVLGVVAVMCFGLLAGVPAIILGHMAHRQIRRDPDRYGGRGLAIAGFALGYLSIITSLILAGLLLPALAKYKERAQSIACANNLKQLGLAFRVWSSDHGGNYPFATSTNLPAQNLTSEERAEDSEIQALSALKRLTAEIPAPGILVCPADGSKRPAASMSRLTGANVSYEIESGPDVNERNPGQILARCPIHDHELLCDGSVQYGR